MKFSAIMAFFAFVNLSYAQEVPPVIYSAPAPIEVDVPYYQPKESVEKIYTNIVKDSEFFLEINPLRMSGASFDFTSSQKTNQYYDLESSSSEFNFKLMPLDFKFGFENANWGSFAEILIQDSTQNSELVVFGKVSGHKLGAGFAINITEDEIKAKSGGKILVNGKSERTQLNAYFYGAFKIIDNETMSLEQWTKFGGGYEKTESEGVTIKDVFCTINPALDLMFKINKKLQIGSGVELSYTRSAGDIKVTGSDSYDGVGDLFSYELNLIKTKFVF